MNKDRKRTLICSTALFTVFGIALIIWPAEAKKAICFAAGIAVAMFGLIKLMKTVKDKTFFLPEGKAGISAAVLLAGVVLAIKTPVLAAVILPLLGAVLFGDGLFKLNIALEEKSTALPRWRRNVIISGVIMAAALFVLFCNGWEKDAVTVSAGALFVLNGIYGGWLCFEGKAPAALPEAANN